MTFDNFNWFLHALLFLHAQKVLAQQEKKLARAEVEEDESDDEEEIGEGYDAMDDD
jgi:hypothetical protein